MSAMKLVLHALFTASIAAATLIPASVTAQPPPGRQMRVILTYPPGGASDIMGRIMAQKLGEIWGQTVLVENRGARTARSASSTRRASPPMVPRS